MNVKFGSWNRVKPAHELSASQDGTVQCQTLQNFICRDKKIKKVGGTNTYNTTALSHNIPWVKRSYHLIGDNTFVSRTFVFNNGTFYYGNDATGALTSCLTGFNALSIPLDFTFQVSGNSILYVFNGLDTPYYYDGNGSYQWYKSGLPADILAGAEHLDRAFFIKRNSSFLSYSETITPEEIEDEIIVGNDRDGVNLAIVRGADESFYVFKNNAIYQLYGRTPSTFQMRIVTDKYGLTSKRAICAVGGGFIFQNQFDKELYFFSGNESSIQPLTEQEVRLREIMNLTTDALDRSCMTVHDGLFRFSFQSFDSEFDYNNAEIIYPITEPQPNGLPKWSYIKGSNVLSYSVWAQQGDKNELVTGRSDIGKIVYHNRGHDFDGNAIETKVRTAEIVGSDEHIMRFSGFYIKAKPSSATVSSTFRYYLNGREAERGEHSLSMKGETRTIGNVYIQKGNIFNDRINPFVGYSRGTSISFEVQDYANGTDLELYSITFNAQKRRKIRNQYF